jgi:hypothetical protein
MLKNRIYNIVNNLAVVTVVVVVIIIPALAWR